MKHFHDEDQLVAAIARQFLAGRAGQLRLGIGDDAALWKPRRGFASILTSDWFLEDSHFLREKHPPDSVGWKCLARAASDIAAMGGTPKCFLLNLAISEDATGKWLSGFLGGLRRAAKSLQCVLSGGDTTRSKRILISVTVIGEIREGQEVRRSGAQPGDLIYVSGTLGEAEHGLRLLRKSKRRINSKNAAIKKHFYPEPRVELGRWLAERKLATAMMDVSDGLSTDLRRLCAASGVGALIDQDKLPVLPEIPADSARQLALHGGDDYELVFTVAPRRADRLPRMFQKLKLTQIGEVRSGCDVRIVNKYGQPQELRRAGWDPFRASS